VLESCEVKLEDLSINRITESMNKQYHPAVIYFLPTAIILCVIGWGGLFLLLINTLPTLGPRWLFFFFGVLALTGTVLPVMAFLNRRFPSQPPATRMTILRQALWFGIYVPTLAWLQLGRALTPALAFLLAIGFFLIEWLLRLREKSRWEPN
jgi:hypothetical protein